MRSQISEQILRILAGGNITKDFRYDIREINLLVNQYRDALVRRDMLQDRQMNLLEDILYDTTEDNVTTFENIEVLYNSNTNIYYSKMPVSPMSLPSGKGVFMVSLMQSQYKPFLPISPSFISSTYGTERADLGGNIGYYREGDKIIYHNIDCNKPKYVLIKMIVSASDLSDEQLNIPNHLQAEIIQSIVALLQPALAVQEDNKNDNISK